MMASAPQIEEDAPTALIQPLAPRRSRLIALYVTLAVIALVIGIVISATRQRDHMTAADAAPPTERAVIATANPGLPTPTPLATTPTPPPAPTPIPPTAMPPTAAPAVSAPPPAAAPPVQAAPVNQRPVSPPGNGHGKGNDGKDKGKGD